MRLSVRNGGLSGLVILCGFAVAASSTASTFAAAPGTITEYSAGLPPASDPTEITPGPEGDLWFTDASTQAALGRVTIAGAVSEISAGLEPGSQPYGITTGPEGDLWFTDRGHPSAVGRATPTSGVITEFSAGLPPEAFLWSNIVPGSDGNLWFIDQGALVSIDHVTPTEQISQLADHQSPAAIAPGSDGNLWVAGQGMGYTGTVTRVTPGGEATVFSAGLDKEADPIRIAPGPDGNLWFVDDGPTKAIGRITPTGQITEYPISSNKESWLLAITAGSDGNIWFADARAEAIGRITMAGEVTEFSTGLAPGTALSGLSPGADGNVWFVGQRGWGHASLGEISTGASAALTAAPAVIGAGRVGESQSCDAAQWASWTGAQPSSTLDAFDGYRWLLDGSPVAVGQSFTPTASDAGHQLSCQQTVTYPLPYLVSAVGTSTPIAVNTPPIPPPLMGRVRASAARWREGNRLARVSSARRSPQRSAVGATFSFSLNESAALSFQFTRRFTGRKIGHRCVRVTLTDRRRKPCKRAIPAGTLLLPGSLGLDHVFFQGRISRFKKLQPGNYVLTITATNSTKESSAPQSLSFTILR